jgi:hypothetical protein
MFSSGVNRQELVSIADVICGMSAIPRPSRDARRGYLTIVKWFENNWELVSVYLPFIQLRDENGGVINASREVFDRYS